MATPHIILFPATGTEPVAGSATAPAAFEAEVKRMPDAVPVICHVAQGQDAEDKGRASWLSQKIVAMGREPVLLTDPALCPKAGRQTDGNVAFQLMLIPAAEE